MVLVPQVQQGHPLETKRKSHYAKPVLTRWFFANCVNSVGNPGMRDPIKVYDARWEVAEFDDAQVTRLFEATLAYGRLLGVDTVTFARDARLGCRGC